MPKPNLRFVSRMAYSHFMRFTTLLVWLGIHRRYESVHKLLIAIKLNNWAEQRKISRYELLILVEIHKSMKIDRSRIDDFLLPRVKKGEAVLTQLMGMTGKALPISETEFIRLTEEAKGGDFLFSYDSGPYEPLKSRGLGSITNNDLRAKIIEFYESFLPIFTIFIHDGDDYHYEKLDQLLNELLSRVVVEDSAGKWYIHRKLTVETPLSHPAFLEFMNIEVERASNDRSRLTEIINNYENMMSEINAELSR